MKRIPTRKMVVLLGLFGAALFCFLHSLYRFGEPRDQGRPISHWLSEINEWSLLSWSGELYPADDAKVQRIGDALRRMGTNATPWVIGELCLEETWLRQQLYRIRDYYPTELVAERRRRAIWACQQLGKDAQAALPALQQVIVTGSDSMGIPAVRAIEAIDSKEVVALLESAHLRGPLVQRMIISASPQEEAALPVVIPKLISLLQGDSARPSLPVSSEAGSAPGIRIMMEMTGARQAAAWKLGRIGKMPALAIPALTNALTNEDLSLRVATIEAIQQFRTNAVAAVPALTALAASDSRPGVRLRALGALSAITNPPPARGWKTFQVPILPDSTQTNGVKR